MHPIPGLPLLGFTSALDKGLIKSVLNSSEHGRAPGCLKAFALKLSGPSSTILFSFSAGALPLLLCSRSSPADGLAALPKEASPSRGHGLSLSELRGRV